MVKMDKKIALKKYWMMTGSQMSMVKSISPEFKAVAKLV